MRFRALGLALLTLAALTLAACGAGAPRGASLHVRLGGAKGLYALSSSYQVTFSWTLPAFAATTGYNTFQDGAQVGSPAGSPYVFSSLACGQTYTLGVQAHNGSGGTGPTYSTSYTTPACPAGGATVNSALPVVTDSTVTSAFVSGDTLSASTGTWTGGPSFTYQWQRCDVNTLSCSAIGAATASTYVPTSSDYYHTLQAVVTANGATSVTSPITPVVTPGGSTTCSLYASPSGSSGNPGTSGSPKDLQSMANALTAGQTGCLLTGTYAGWSGVSAPAGGVVITTAPSVAVTLPLGNSSQTWNLSSLANFTIDGGLNGGTIAVPANTYIWQGSTTTALNVTIRNVTMTSPTGFSIFSPHNANVVFSHDAFPNTPAVNCSTGEGVRWHLAYGDAAESGFVIQASSFVGGAWDAIQTGTPFTAIDNYFNTVQEGSFTSCHTDSIQSIGSSSTIKYQVKGNLFVQDSDGLGWFDGSNTTDTQNNVWDNLPGNGPITINNDTNSIISHNTFLNANSQDIDLTSKAAPADTGEVITDNVLGLPATTTLISVNGGGCGCLATPSQIDYNLTAPGATLANGGSWPTAHNVSGTPAFQGGTGPFTQHDSYLLTSGSAGHAIANDGTDAGTAAVGTVNYGPMTSG